MIVKNIANGSLLPIAVKRRPDQGLIMLSRTNDTPLWVETRLRNRWRKLEQITFAIFMGTLVTLLVLLYADVPIVGF